MPKVNLKILVPLILFVGTVLGVVCYFMQEKDPMTSPQTYIEKPKTREQAPDPSSQETSAPEAPRDTETPQNSQNEALVKQFIQTYFTQELTLDALKQRLETLKSITTEDFQEERDLEGVTQVMMHMLASYEETQVSPSGTANVNAQEIVKSQFFKSEESENEVFVQVEYTVTPLGSKECATMKNQVTVDIEEGKIASMSILNTPEEGEKDA